MSLTFDPSKVDTEPVMLNLPATTAAQEMNLLHQKIKAAQVSAKDMAAKLGDILIAKKASLKHGEFKPWVEANCIFAYRGAAEYMQVAKTKSADLRTFEKCNSIREVLTLKATKGDKPSPTKKPNLDYDDKRKIKKLLSVFNDPVTPQPMKEAVGTKLKGYEEAHGSHYDDFVDGLDDVVDNGDDDTNVVDRDYIAEKMVETVLRNLDKEPAKDYLTMVFLDAYKDDSVLTREFNNLMREVEIW